MIIIILNPLLQQLNCVESSTIPIAENDINMNTIFNGNYTFLFGKDGEQKACVLGYEKKEGGGKF